MNGVLSLRGRFPDYIKEGILAGKALFMGKNNDDCRSRVQDIDRIIQKRGKADPQDIGNEEVGSSLLYPKEAYDGCKDQDPQDENINQAEEWRLHPEEEERPCDIEDELHGKDAKGDPDIALFNALLPDHPEGDPHEDEEQGPDRAKEPPRRRERGLCQQGIPGAGAGNGHDPAQAAKDNTGYYGCNQCNRVLHAHFIKSSHALLVLPAPT